MKRGLLLSILSLWAATAQAGGFWNSLWHNADQQGEQLLHQGNATAAAQTFNDPRRKAYAELQAGDFSNAAKHFSAFDDSNGNYNRGNALAQAGQLQEAINAYDAALAHDPHDQDARYNRDLVAKALEQQQQKPSSDNASSSGDSKNSGKNRANKSGQSDDKDSGKQGNAKNNSGNQNPPGQNQTGKEHQGKNGQGKTGNSGDQKAGQGRQQPAQSNQPDSKNQTNASGQTDGQTRPDDAAQARRDAAAALGQAPTGKAGTPADAPASEQQLAQEQWLRNIPDDPGGLLRRKFMIEHMIRQQGGQQ